MFLEHLWTQQQEKNTRYQQKYFIVLLKTINSLKTNIIPNLNMQSVPRSKHFPSGL
jgi:hypothetical protein